MSRRVREPEDAWNAVARLQRELAGLVEPVMECEGTALLEPGSPLATERRSIVERVRADAMRLTARFCEPAESVATHLPWVV